jgi:hypothetical protein
MNENESTKAKSTNKRKSQSVVTKLKKKLNKKNFTLKTVLLSLGTGLVLGATVVGVILASGGSLDD